MLSKYLDPTNDIAFKTIFGTEKNKDILIHFLNDILVFKNKQPVVEVEFLKTIQDPIIASQKTSIVDILCKDKQGSRYIVEMQVARTMGFEKRAQYYASKTYCSQAQVADKYPDLKEVVFIAIADFIMFPDKKRYKSDHVILDRESYEHDLKDFSFTFIELPKFKKKIGQLSNLEEKWCYFFKHAKETSSEDLEKIIGKDIIIQKAYTELDRFHWSAEGLRTYEESEKRINDYLSSLGQKFIEGKVQGARSMQIETVENMLKEKLPLSIIVRISSLTLEEIKKIQASKKLVRSKSTGSIKSKKRVKKN